MTFVNFTGIYLLDQETLAQAIKNLECMTNEGLKFLTEYNKAENTNFYAEEMLYFLKTEAWDRRCNLSWQ
jgi:hypothetical protein